MSNITEPLQSIIIKGNKFFYETSGEQFFAKGVFHITWTSNVTDILYSARICYEEGSMMKEAGINTIFVWLVNPIREFVACIQEFQKFGIYILVRIEGLFLEPPPRSLKSYDGVFAAFDAIASIPNILGIIIADQSYASTHTAAIGPGYANTKALIRDLKIYMKETGYRQIPIGVASNNFGKYAFETEYLRCGDRQEQMMDFRLQYPVSDCDLKTNPDRFGSSSEFAKYPVPLLLGDFACGNISANSSREFKEISLLYDSEYSAIWSGGFVYKWREDQEHYGLVDFKWTGNSLSIVPLPEVQRARHEFLDVLPSKETLSYYEPPSPTSVACPTVKSGYGDWPIHSSLPPTPNQEVCDCMSAVNPCVVLPSLSDVVAGRYVRDFCSSNSSICVGLVSNVTTGQHGAFSFCEETQKLAWILNYLRSRGRTPDNSCATSGIESFVITRTISLSPSCSTLLASAGPLGATTIDYWQKAFVTPATTSVVVTSSRSPQQTSDATADSLPSGDTNRGRPTAGALVGIVIGSISLIALLMATYLLWRRNRKAKFSQESEGLEAGLPPAGYEHVRNVELQGHQSTPSDIPESKPIEIDTQEDALKPPIIQLESSVVETESREENQNHISATVTDVGTLPLMGRLSAVSAVSEAEGRLDRPLSPSWAGIEWFDPNDPGQGLSVSGNSSPRVG